MKFNINDAMMTCVPKPNKPSCPYCIFGVASEHHARCPRESIEDIEIWKSGYDAAMAGDDCYAPIDSVFWLGWLMGGIKKDMSEI